MDAVDLFGNAVRPGHGKRGRPAFEPTEKDRNKVKLLLGFGWSISRIANGIDASPATVKRYFRAELKQRDTMRDRLDARRFEIAMEQANAGNIGALKELGRMIERNDRLYADMALRQAQDSGDTPAERKSERLGKKEAAAKAAETAGEGSSWGSDLQPGLPIQ